MRRLIVNADDLGRAPGVDRGVLRAHRDGIVTSATFMANVPGAERTAMLARESPTLDLGIHLSITFGRPLSDALQVPSLLRPDGTFHPRPSDIVGRGIVTRDDVLRECRAQLSRARALLGRDPSHADTHHFVHDDPAVFEALVELAREHGLAVRHHTVAQRERLRAEGIRTPDHFRREFQFAGHIDVPALVGLISSLDDGVTELMCHPGEPDDELERTSTYGRERPVELATLTHPDVRAALDDGGVTLASFADL
ncbi:MAG: ChbG/HpnK family deacetylase [Chloroflexi bacterium]|nr:ChbG/HpnK family deacetylase [Chloroflexota bacterium]